ncbi:MAG TPA: phosphoribosylanthranilate isomerase [Gemmatimonadaceae bacterium]|nr:phosphoribosylanthranilate isomerase [Gemmatimonadaceae bacterium]
MAPEIKFCGLTRAEDVREAVALGASYVGVIFAGGPRNLTPARAREVLGEVPGRVRRVGVFGDQSPEEIATAAFEASLSVVQLHGASDPMRISRIRDQFTGEVWPVLRVAGAELPPEAAELAYAGDGLLLDALVAGGLGGTGVTLPWDALSAAIARLRSGVKIVLAGGLRAENVAQAIGALDPDVVDVSSGVEQPGSPGVKDHQRMRAFRDAVESVSAEFRAKARSAEARNNQSPR